MTTSYDLHKQRVETLRCVSSIPPPSVGSDEAVDGFTSMAMCFCRERSIPCKYTADKEFSVFALLAAVAL